MLKKCFTYLCRANRRHFATRLAIEKAELPDLPFATKAGDILSYQIQHRLAGCQSCLAFCNKYLHRLSSQHVLLLMRTLYNEYSTTMLDMSNSEKIEYMQTFKQLYSMYIAHDTRFDSAPAVLNFLAIMGSYELKGAHIITPKLMAKLEAKICENITQYKDYALETCLSSFEQVKYVPRKFVEALKMSDPRLLTCGRKSLFTVARHLQNFDLIDDELFVSIYNRTLVLYDSFSSRDLIRGLIFFNTLRKAGFFARVNSKIDLQSHFYPMAQHLINKLKSKLRKRLIMLVFSTSGIRYEVVTGDFVADRVDNSVHRSRQIHRHHHGHPFIRCKVHLMHTRCLRYVALFAPPHYVRLS